jgi:hypothetical protein
MESDFERPLEQARQLTARLERLSADSTWARRASGYRASLLKAIGKLEQLQQQASLPAGQDEAELEYELQRLIQLTQQGYRILDLAARDLIRSRIRGSR